MKDRTALTASAVVLALALLGSGWLLFRAWRNMKGLAPADRARVLNTRMDEAQAELAANESLLRVREVARSSPDAAALERSLSQAARATRDAVSRTDADLVRVQLAAIAFHVSGAEAGDLWCASPLAHEDTEWLHGTLGKLGNRADGSAYEIDETRSRGLAFATFAVDGHERRGGIYWMLALRTSER